MSYAVKEIFRTLQGEGHHSGRRAVFCRFAGCNLWSGREQDRAAAACKFCDTDFVGLDGSNGGRYEAVALARKCASVWGDGYKHRFIVLTGGEPMLQVDSFLIDVLHRWEFEVAVETNGTCECPDSLDWITVSPKTPELAQQRGNELKLVFPQEGLGPEMFAGLPFQHFYLQPKWVADEAVRASNLQAAIDHCMGDPLWNLGIQMHKSVGLR